MTRAQELFARLEAAGEQALDELIAARQSEELFLDFKRSADAGSGTRLHPNDRANLGKAISGFGNSEGGVIVWGVDCSADHSGADLPRFKVPLSDSAKFVSWLEAAVSGTTVPPHSGVRSIKVGRHFAATLVAASDRAPHQTVQGQQYYIRAGSSFLPTPHAVLAGMFGRRPSPNVFHKFVSAPAKVDRPRLEFEVGIYVRNQGPGIATDLYLNLTFSEAAWGGSKISFEINHDAWVGQQSFGVITSLISKPGIRLPPESHIQALLLGVTLWAPFKSGIRADGMVGSGSSPPHRFEFNTSRRRLQAIYEKTLADHDNGLLTEKRLANLPAVTFGIRNPKRR